MVEKADSDLIGLTSLDAQLSAIISILAAVHCIHKLYGIQHCDIKIANVLKRIYQNKLMNIFDIL